WMRPEGHMLAGWITFSPATKQGVPVVQIQALERTNDPLYELGFALGGNRMNTKFWVQTAEKLARHFAGAPRARHTPPRPLGVGPRVAPRGVCVGRHRQWRKAGNLWHNAAVRTFLWRLAGALRWLRSPPRPARGPRTLCPPRRRPTP